MPTQNVIKLPASTGSAATQFKPGQSGNPAGRPVGARSKLGEEFLSALHDDFAEHGVDVIRKVREERPHEYLKIVAGLLPKELSVSRPNVIEEMTDGELEAVIEMLLAHNQATQDTGGDTAEQE